MCAYFRFSVGALLVGLAPICAAQTNDCNHNGIPDNIDIQGRISFVAAPSYPAGTSPGHIVAADFDGDGFDDLAVSYFFYPAISVFRNNGDGTFAPRVDYPTIDPNGAALVVADFNGDGRPDLAVGLATANIVSVFLNDGHGGLIHQTDLNTPAYAYVMVAADFTGDGRPDLITGNWDALGLSLFENLGDGTFSAAMPISFEYKPLALSAADLNGDGNTDLVIGAWGDDYYGYDRILQLLRGAGDGQFQFLDGEESFDTAFQLAVSKLDGGPTLTLLTSEYSPFGDGYVGFYVLNPDGTLGDFSYYYTFAAPDAVKPVDLDGDGRLDLVLPDYGDSAIGIAHNDGAAQFTSTTFAGVDGYPNDVAVADFDHDGRPDIATVNDETNSVSILRNAGNMHFVARPTLGYFFVPGGNAIADTTGSGRNDLLILSVDGVTIYATSDGIGWNLRQYVQTPDKGMESFVVADFNRDGFPDMAVTVEGSQDVRLYLNAGNGTFPGYVPWPSGLQYPYCELVADVDGDGYPDLIADQYYPDQIAILINNRQNGFLAPKLINVPTFSGLTLADLAGDGLPDLIVSEDTALQFVVFKNMGNGLFQPTASYATDYKPSGLLALDVNEDGHPDIVETEFTIGVFNFWLNDGSGNLVRGPALECPIGANLAIAADLDQDAHQDLIVSSYRYPDSISIYRNLGHGEFAPRQDYSTGGSYVPPAAGDLTGDGYPEVVWVSGSAASIMTSTSLRPARDDNHNGIPDECECLGDLNGNHVVELADLATLLGAYGTNAGGDLNGDGVTNLQDLAILLPRYGAVCP